LIVELDTLFLRLSKGDVDERGAAMSRLISYEQAGKLPLESILEMAEEDNPAVSMYAISALGRSRNPRAVSKLLEMAQAHRAGNALFLETIIDALGDAGDPEATALLLEFLGIKLGWKNKLLGKLSFKKDELSEEEVQRRDALALPIVRALEKIHDPRSAEALWMLLDSDDPLVRWHAIQTVLKCELTEFVAKLRGFAEHDTSPLVKEMAQIALAKLETIPQHLDN
jgi:HEAT repeat protein